MVSQETIDSITARLDALEAWRASLDTPAVPPAPAPLGIVTPVVLYFGFGVQQPVLDGLEAALLAAQDWYRGRLGKTFTYSKPIALPAKSSFEYYMLDPWGRVQETLRAHVQPLWGYSRAIAAFIEGMPHTTAGLGGGSNNEQTSGLVVKDGDALTIWEQGPSHPEWNRTTGMLCHELMHAFVTIGDPIGEHYDAPGDNIEYEWWNWPSGGFNQYTIAALKDSIFLGQGL